MASDFFATINDKRISKAEILLPHFGIWSADVWLDGSDAITGAVTIKLGTMRLVGTVYRGDVYTGQTAVRVVGGYGGWRKILKARSYTHEAGIKASTVLGDVAKEVGEQLTLSSDVRVGSFFVRKACPASRVFEQMGVNYWYVDIDGVTKTSARASTKISAKFDVTSVDQRTGMASVATEAPEAFIPGATVDLKLSAVSTISTVLHKIGKDSFRTELTLQ